MPEYWTPEQQAIRNKFLADMDLNDPYDQEVLMYMDQGCPFCEAPAYTACPHFTADGAEQHPDHNFHPNPSNN